MYLYFINKSLLKARIEDFSKFKISSFLKIKLKRSYNCVSQSFFFIIIINNKLKLLFFIIHIKFCFVYRYRLAVIKALPQLEKLDNVIIENSETVKAQNYGKTLYRPDQMAVFIYLIILLLSEVTFSSYQLRFFGGKFSFWF